MSENPEHWQAVARWIGEGGAECLQEVVHQAAEAATVPLLADNPGYVFPSERVLEAVEAVIASFAEREAVE